MKKGLFILMMMCAMTLNSSAQIYGGESALQLPVRDIYDTELMNAYANALRETAASRLQDFHFFTDRAMEAMAQEKWDLAIKCIDMALGTGYYNGDLYWMRGLSNEKLGDYTTAKADYKTGKKLGSEYAGQALEALKERMKRK